jgi:hypothetical protein
MNDGTTYLIFLELPVKDLWGTLVPICRDRSHKKGSAQTPAVVYTGTP